MSDEIERRLRAAGHRLPAPTDADTLSARQRFIGSFTPRRRLGRPAVFALAAALAVGGAFGVGYGLAAGTTETKTKVVRVHEKLDAGPGFLPAAGWDTAASGTASPLLTAEAANTTLQSDGTTASKLGANGVYIRATFTSAAADPSLPQKLLPLRLDDATPASGSTRQLHVRVAGYAVDATIAFGTAHPLQSVVVAAREELGRLVVPSCPAAQPLTAADIAVAKASVLDWLPAHYAGDAGDVVGATATAKAGAAAPRHGEAAADCGAAVAARSIEVDVVLPKLAAVSASLSQLTYFVAKTAAGFVVWERAR